jgi:hypothetical protein
VYLLAAGVLIVLVGTVAVGLARGPHAYADASAGGGDFVPLAVTRVLDTRNGTGGVSQPIGTAATVSFPVLGRGGIPATGVRAVHADVTIVKPTTTTWVVAWADGQTRPADTSALSAAANETVSTSMIVPVGTNGKVALFNRLGSTNAVVDIEGYYTAATTADTGRGGFVPVAQTRVMDTSTGLGAPKAKLANGAKLDVQITGNLVPAAANAVFVDVRTVGASGTGWVTAGPSGSSGTTSAVDFMTGDYSSGLAVQLGSAGKIALTVHLSAGNMDVQVTVQGWFSGTPSEGAGLRLATGKLLSGLSSASTVPANGTVDLVVGGAFGLPTRAIAAAALNFKTNNQTAAGTLRAWPLGDPEPNTTILTWPASGQRENLALVRPGVEGKVRVRNISGSPVNVDVDLQGWYAEVRPNVPPRRYSPTAVFQAAPAAGATAGLLTYSYADNVGFERLGLQQPDNANTLQWTTISKGEQFTGEPALAQQPDGKVLLAVQHGSGDIWIHTRLSAGSATGTWTNTGGSMATRPALGVMPDGSLVVFAVDVDGRLWYLAQSAPNGPFGFWQSLGDHDLVDVPAVVTLRDGLRLFGLDASGQVQTLSFFAGGGTSAWTALGGSGFTGSPAVVLYPGFRSRVFVRGGDGTVLTKAQNSDGTFEADWSPLPGFLAVGSPAAVISPLTGKTEVVARDAAGGIASTGEVTEGSGTWRNWTQVLVPPDVAATDPTTVTFTDGVTDTWAFVFRDADNRNHLYVVPATAGAAKAMSPAFGDVQLPVPPD